MPCAVWHNVSCCILQEGRTAHTDTLAFFVVEVIRVNDCFIATVGLDGLVGVFTPCATRWVSQGAATSTCGGGGMGVWEGTWECKGVWGCK